MSSIIVEIYKDYDEHLEYRLKVIGDDNILPDRYLAELISKIANAAYCQGQNDLRSELKNLLGIDE